MVLLHARLDGRDDRRARRTPDLQRAAEDRAHHPRDLGRRGCKHRNATTVGLVREDH